MYVYILTSVNEIIHFLILITALYGMRAIFTPKNFLDYPQFRLFFTKCKTYKEKGACINTNNLVIYITIAHCLGLTCFQMV